MLDKIDLMFNQFPAIWLATVFIMTACIGSFLNVVIHRLPLMMKREWRCDCREFLADELDEKTSKAKQQQDQGNYNLVVPASTCPSCGTKIKPWHNIPIFGWLLLRGKCANCSQAISPRYPIIELATALLCTFAAWQFGYSLAAIAAIVFTCLLVAMIFIDADTMLLPDQLTLPLLWLGLLLNLNATFVSLNDAVIGAAVGYLSLWSVFWLFKLLTGKEGMGYGDFKLLAALGAWMGYQAILPIILMSSLVGAVLGIIMLKAQSKDSSNPIPFGPYLAVAGWIVFYWQQDLIQFYQQTFMVN